MSSIPTMEVPQKKILKESPVDHTYRDYSRVRISHFGGGYNGAANNQELFPSKLHAILSMPEYARIIAWRPHGRAWRVLDKAEFESVVLPIHFNHSNFQSFNRSVNGWGFKRLVRAGPDQNAYYHELFLRGRPELTSLMTRLLKPGKRLPNKDEEPDFDEISRMYPLPNPPAAHQSFPEEASIVYNEQVPTSTFTPPPAAEHYKLPHSPDICPHEGYHPRDPMTYLQPQSYSRPPPYSQPPPYPQPPHHPQPAPYPQPSPYHYHQGQSHSQPPHYYVQHPAHLEPPSFSQPPPDYFPPLFGTDTSAPGRFYHPHLHAAGPQQGVTPSAPFHHHPAQWGRVKVPAREWQHPSPPQPSHNYRPPAHDIAPRKPMTYAERMLPILHHGAPKAYEAEERKPAAQGIPTPDQDGALLTRCFPSQT